VSKVLQGNFVVGVPSNYLISVTNTGQADTLAGTITDTIPAGLTLGTLPAGCTAVGQNLTCTIPAGISAGTGISFTIPVTPQASTSGQSLSNSATAHDGPIDPWLYQGRLYCARDVLAFGRSPSWVSSTTISQLGSDCRWRTPSSTGSGGPVRT
jgi:uncharacterized repeat protein (TIGR01451 family)